MQTSRSFVVILASAMLVTGCYTLQPVAGTPAVEGAQMAFDLTDAGRVALGGSMGPSLARIEGRLVRRESDEYLVAVTSVSYIAGGSQRWSGETVRVKPGHVGTMYLRRLSKGRTLAAVALGVGAAAFIATRTLDGGGSAPRPSPTDSTGVTHRGPRP